MQKKKVFFLFLADQFHENFGSKMRKIKNPILLNCYTIAFYLLAVVLSEVHLHPQRKQTQNSVDLKINATKPNEGTSSAPTPTPTPTTNIVHNDADIVLMLVKTEKEATAAVKTLNSIVANTTNGNDGEKPVSKQFDVNNRGNVYIVESNNVNKSIKSESSGRSRQYNIPFIPISMNWISNIRPSNAIVMTDKPPLRIWAIGSVSKFPDFIERFLQRVQSYYSIYKYSDLSRPAPLAIINQQYHEHDSEEVEELIEVDTDTPSYDDEDGDDENGDGHGHDQGYGVDDEETTTDSTNSYENSTDSESSFESMELE